MNKKATIKIVVGITILLVFLAVILISFFCPTCLASSIAYGAESVADPILGGLRNEKFEKTSLKAHSDIETMYNDIVKTLRADGEGPCMLEHQEFPDGFEDYEIVLSLEEENTIAQLINKKDQVVRKKTIANRKPCAVLPQNFYNNFLDETPCHAPPPTCPINYRVADLLFTDNDDIYIGTRNRDDKSKNKESKDKGLVFKTRDGNVCFFPTDNDRWNDNCDNKIKGIDEDCFDEIKEEILMCS